MLILNRTNNDNGSRHLARLYVPLEPKYLSPNTNISSGSVCSSQSFVGDNHQFFGPSLDDLMNQRRDIIHSKTQMLISEIYKRYELKKDNLYQIDLDQCACRNLIFLMGDVYLDKRRIELERKIIDLEQEKRKEQAGCFKDILFIKKELRESIIEKLEEEQKADFFMNKPEELPCKV